MQRLEFKYLVPAAHLDRIRAEIRPFVRADAHCSQCCPMEYTVRSIYYDTPGMACYNEKVEGVRVRRKYRIRGYNEMTADSQVFLEIKRKKDSYIAKSRAHFHWPLFDSVVRCHRPEKYFLSAEDEDRNCGPDASSFLFYYHSLRLRPTALILYDREAFHGRMDPGLRITFDKNLRSLPATSPELLFSKAPLRAVMQRYFILEVKFCGGLPRWLCSLTERFELPRMALSKYTICLDSHRAVRPLGRHLTLRDVDHTPAPTAETSGAICA